MEPRNANSSPRITSVRKLRSAYGRSGRFSLTRGIRRFVWVVPLVAVLGLVFAATWVRGKMEESMKVQLRSELQALLNADVEALKLWFAAQENNVEVAVQAPALRQEALALVELGKSPETSQGTLLEAPARKQFNKLIKPWLDELGYIGFVLIDRQHRVLASETENLVGQLSMPGVAPLVERVLAGEAMVSRPYSANVLMQDEFGRVSAGVPTMFTAAPLRDDQGQIVAVLGMRIRPDEEFTKILNVARIGETGETYAFDKDGLMLSASRFEDQLKQIGLQVDNPYSRSELTIEIRDPGVDMTVGARPGQPRAEQPLTLMAREATAGRSDVNVDGYRDYRGVEVVGAWTWLPEYGMGITTEVDKAEAFASMLVLRTAFWSLFALLATAALLLLGIAFVTKRLEKRMREAVVAVGKLGQYALEEKIGEGGMGSVYRGRHAMLRRPTAIKLLEPSKTTNISIERFEREVQLTSQLNHPNTITIYDYGRTQEGVFYYAMEYLDGFSLQTLVERFGPQPDGRVIQVLLQVCGSLLEAHTLGLIHRDVKPANIMLTRRGGVRDYVKLLDFGLVKAVDSSKMRMLTAANAITGTPLYLSPEAVQDADTADARSDLYSLGAVGYFLLTGHPVFESGSVMEIIRQHVETPPTPPGQRVHRPVSADLEALIMKCLEKSPDARPQSAAELAEALLHCTPAAPWTAADCTRWWKVYEPGSDGESSGDATQKISLAGTIGYSDFQPKR